MADFLSLNLRRQILVLDDGGHRHWRSIEEQVSWPSAETALLLCDVWDSHWCRGARERLEPLVPRMNAAVAAARSAGVQIVHAPSDTMAFYEGHPARQRAQAVTPTDPREGLPAAAQDPDSLVGFLFAPSGEVAEYDPPLPVDAADNGTTVAEDEPYKAWKSQHPGIDIDPERDLISDDGRVVHAFLRERNIGRMLILGVHTNMCVLHRSFAIKQMARWGMEMVLIRDLTDTMYSPARPPYVDHDEGTRLVVEYVEKFWGASLDSADLTAGVG
jgi:nicotinamidase-related amidase